MSSRADRIIEKAFLGSEFLTWLWYASEVSDGRFMLDGEQVELRFEDLLVLESILADSQENTFKGGEPTRSEEARLALRLGKKVSRAKLKLRRGEREFAFTVRAANLDLSAIKLPAVLARSEEEAFYERFYLLEELDKTIQQLYLAFLARRLGPAWEGEILPALRAWVQQGPDGEGAAAARPGIPPAIELS